MHYRFGTVHDCCQMYELICELEDAQLPYDRFSEIWHKQRNNPDYLSLVCEEDGILLGALNLRFEEQLHHVELMTEIMELAVRSDTRNKGIGKELINWAYRIARDRGSPQIEASCNQTRVHAHRFYQREGMRCRHFKFSRRLSGNDSSENTL